MAETVQVNKPAPFLEAGGKTLLDLVTKQTGTPVQTAGFAPSVAGADPFTQQAQQAAASQAGLGTLSFDSTGAVSGIAAGTGLAGYQPYLTGAADLRGPGAGTGTGSVASYMSPYTTNVIDAMKQQMADTKAQQDTARSAQALQAGAFGGSRAGVQQSVADTEYNQALAAMVAQQNAMAYQQAVGARQADQQTNLGLAQLQPQLAAQNIGQLGGMGTSGLAYRQAITDADAQTAKLAAYEPYQRYGFFGEQLTGLMGGYPGGTRMTSAPSASPLQQALGMGISGAALYKGLTG
tara:strand:- start:5231 stop:6109 length:879 start_codon:yes stop_codon:yes gene_type:complete